MAFSLVAHTHGQGATGGTSGAVNTTGANLLVACIARYTGGGNPTISDSKGNTWVQLGFTQASGSQTDLWFYYSIPTSVGIGHTFTCGVSGGNNYACICVQAWSGAYTAPLDNQYPLTATATQPGNITPNQANALLVTACCPQSTDSATAVDSGFTISDNVAYASGTNMAAALAYLVESAATTQNPTWTQSAGTPATAIASFVTTAPNTTPASTRNLTVPMLSGDLIDPAGGTGELIGPPLSSAGNSDPAFFVPGGAAGTAGEAFVLVMA